jgi:FAD/FMN-containing dehydrogenase
MNTGKLHTLQKDIAGQVVLPDNPAYEQLRQTMFRRTSRPAVIVLCKNSQDVAIAVSFARDSKLKLSVRSGGHGGAGLATNDGGLVIDLSPLNDVEVVDSQRHIVRIGAGAHWGDVAKALEAHQLAISSGDTTSVGVGGLTLGGGMGWMVRLHGLSIDSLEAVTLVTADGKVVRVSEHEHPDLFWALRGGTGNFGVAVSFDFKAYPCDGIVGGVIIYSADDRKTVLTDWAAYMRRAPEELSSTVVLFPGFGPGAKPQVMILVCYGGSDEVAAYTAIQPLMELAPLVSQDVKKKPYSDMLEEAMSPGPMKVRVRNGFIKHLDSAVIEVLVSNFGKPNTSPIQIRSLGGAMNRVDPMATAFAHRDSEAFVLVPAFGAAEMLEAEANALADEVWRPLVPFARGAYVNFFTDVSSERVAAAYPPATMERLAHIKAIYDPDNLFNQNANIKPAASGA